MPGIELSAVLGLVMTLREGHPQVNGPYTDRIQDEEKSAEPAWSWSLERG